MLPTPQTELRERRRARIRAGLLLLPLLAASPLLLGVHPLAMPLFLLIACLAAIVCYRQGMECIRRRRTLLALPFPEEWETILQERVDYYRALPATMQERYRQLVQIFLDEKPIEGAGLEITDLLRVLAASGAVIPILGLEDWEYGRLEVIVIRPEPFEAHFTRDPDEPLYASGLVGDGNIFSGAVVLSRPDMLRDFRRHHDRTNVTIHEFAHLIDLAGGTINGVPACMPVSLIAEWQALIADALERADEGEYADIDDYAFTNESEFFAVSTEYFFSKPTELRRLHPRLYEMLQAAFHQDPATLLEAFEENHAFSS